LLAAPEAVADSEDDDDSDDVAAEDVRC